MATYKDILLEWQEDQIANHGMEKWKISPGPLWNDLTEEERAEVIVNILTCETKPLSDGDLKKIRFDEAFEEV